MPQMKRGMALFALLMTAAAGSACARGEAAPDAQPARTGAEEAFVHVSSARAEEGGEIRVEEASGPVYADGRAVTQGETLPLPVAFTVRSADAPFRVTVARTNGASPLNVEVTRRLAPAFHLQAQGAAVRVARPAGGEISVNSGPLEALLERR